MSREMIVGREHLVGAHHGRDYDELMEMGAEHAPAPPPPQMHPAPPQMQMYSYAQQPSSSYAQQPQPQHPGMHPMTYGPPHQHHHHQEHHERAGGGRMRIVKEEPRHSRQFPIGFQSDAVNPNQEVEIEVKPQVLFRGERLAIAQSIARFFDVVDIKVGKDSQLAATGTLTGEAFETRAVGVRMELDSAEPGIVITLRIRNVDTAPHDFKAVLYGSVLE
jgi:hypothetical protein